MTKSVFNNLKKYKSGKIELSKVASWAIWDENDICNFNYIEKNIDILKNDIVFVGLNFGKKVKYWKDWQNFHCVPRLIELLTEPRAKKIFVGAYMTDIIKNHNETKSDELLRKIKEKEININKNIEFFFKEIELLKSDNIKMYLFGGAVEYIFKKYIIKEPFFQQKVNKCQRIHHYSWRVPDFDKKAPVQLGIRKPKDETEENWKYEPIWEK